jgi:hypothetical protein
VRIVEVDIVDSEALQTLFTSGFGIFRGAIDSALVGAVRLNFCGYTKFGGQKDVGTALRVQFEPLANEIFRIAVCV